MEIKQMNLLFREALKLRQEIHMDPELGNQEFGTTEKLRIFLDNHGICFQPFQDMTGGYVYLDCHKPATVGFRADLDALPIQESTGLPFQSKNRGVMHACGHDMHAAIAACLAVCLEWERQKLNSNILILFQPAEECNPLGGARRVVETGILERYHVKELYGLHMWPSLETGHIAVRPGTMMAASDKFLIRISGKKAHAAEPHKGVDAISIAAETVSAIEHKLRREADPFDAFLVSVGTIRSSGRYNIVCDQVELEGTMRTTAEETRKWLHRRMEEVALEIAKTYRGSATTEIQDGYGIVCNDPELTGKWVKAARQILGESCVHTEILPSLIGEDFSFYSNHVPSVYFFVGCQCQSPLHSDTLIPDERALEVAVRLVAAYFLEQWEEKNEDAAAECHI